MDLIDIKDTLLKHQQICSKILTICALQVFSLELISAVVSFSRIFSIHQEHLFSGTPEGVYYSFFYYNVSSKNLLSLFFCFFKKSDALYLFPRNWLPLIVIDKFTITEFAPFCLFTKGVFVTFGKICLCVKSHSFIFSQIPCYLPFFLLKLNTQFL